MNNHLELEIEGHRLAAVLTHSGDSDLPVFFLHGIGASVYFWTPELTSLFHHLGTCYSLSLPGHFPAVFPKGFPAACLTPEWIARLVSSAIQKIAGNKKALVVGHSTGGFAALSTAIDNPEVVAGIVSIAGFARGQWTGTLGFCQWLVRQGPIGRAIFKKIYQIGGLHPAVFRMYWQAYVHDHIALLKNSQLVAITDSLLPHFRRLDLNALADYFAVMPHTDITPCLSEINAPTCLIAGDKDPIVDHKQSVMTAGEVVNSKLFLIKGSGHLPFFERPTEYKRAIATWLAEFQASC